MARNPQRWTLLGSDPLGFSTGAIRTSCPAAFLCALFVQEGASRHKSVQDATTRKMNIKKEMQGKCLSWLDLGFGVEMSC
jgi:hypothetical protein